MAISDINRAMAMYAQPTEFDQQAWKTAFDISNAFTNSSNNRTLAEENARKHRENLNTELWRTTYQNANFQDNTNQANWNITNRNATQQGIIDFTNAQNQANTVAQQNALVQQQGIQQFYQLTPQLMVDENGRARSNEEIFNIARQNPKLNPALYHQLFGNYQKEAQTNAQEMAHINPQMASQYRTMAGLSPNLVDNSGNVINFNSGEVVGTVSPDQLANFASGNYWQSQLAAQKAQQEALKAQAVAEARLPSTLEAIEARANATLNKQDNWQQHKTNDAELKSVNEAIAQIVANARGDKTQINSSLGVLAQSYPHLKDHIGRQAAIQMQLGL